MYLKLEIITHQWKNQVLLLEGTWVFFCLLYLICLTFGKQCSLSDKTFALRDWHHGSYSGGCKVD